LRFGWPTRPLIPPKRATGLLSVLGLDFPDLARVPFPTGGTMSDTLRWRRVWITARPGRRARFCINWIGDDGAPRRLAYPNRKVRDVARRLKEQEINSWARPPMVVSWLELVAQYGLALAPQSPAHQEKVARVLGRFQKIARPVQSNMVTPAMCDQFMAARAAGELASGDGLRLPSAFTLRDDRAILSAFFAWCVARAYMPANPMEHVHTPRTPRRIPRPPRPADWLKLLQALLAPDLAATPPLGQRIDVHTQHGCDLAGFQHVAGIAHSSFSRYSRVRSNSTSPSRLALAQRLLSLP